MNVATLNLVPVSKLALNTIKKPPVTILAASRVRYQGICLRLPHELLVCLRRGPGCTLPLFASLP